MLIRKFVNDKQLLYGKEKVRGWEKMYHRKDRKERTNQK